MALNKTYTAEFVGDPGQMSQAYEGDAGFDLRYNGDEPLLIAPQTMGRVPTGVHIALPAGMYALVTGRSSTFAKRHLIAPVSVIDNGFRGELFGVVWNIGDTTQEIQPGERIVQVLPMMNVAGVLRWKRVDRLSSSERADQGFGSTGR
jgi:dUTP pyrophosphatase